MSKNQGVVKPEAVMEALSKVQDPELKKDLVSLGMIKDLTVEGSKVSLRVELTTPACPLREKIERDVREAVLGVQGVEEADVQMGSRVPRGSMGPQNLNADLHNVIAVASGKGGVGKTTVAVNIAVALARSGACVGLLDADIYGPNVPTMLGLDQLPPAREKKLVPAEVHGVKVMSIAFLVQPGQPLIWRGPMLHSVIQQFITDVDWGELDWLIIDSPPGTGDEPLSIAQLIPATGAVVVTTPQEVSLMDSRKAVVFALKLNLKVMGIIENMSGMVCPHCGKRIDLFKEGGGNKAALELGIPFLGKIPLDPQIVISGDEGKPFVASQPESEASKAFMKIVENIMKGKAH